MWTKCKLKTEQMFQYKSIIFHLIQRDLEFHATANTLLTIKQIL